jgi:DNA-binding transcriptional LysR family regulator
LRNSVDMAVREVRDVARGSVGHVRLGSGATTTEYLLPSLYSTMLRETPGVTMELIIGMNDVLRASLRKGYLDLVIGPITEVDAEFASVPALEDRVVVVARAGHPLFNKKAKMADLLDYRWVLPGPHVAMRKWLDHAFAANGLKQPDVQIETSSISLLPRMIAHTDLLSFISVRNLGEGHVGSPLREIFLPETTMSRWLGAVYRQEAYLSPACRRMIEIIKAMPKSNPLPKQRRAA